MRSLDQLQRVWVAIAHTLYQGTATLVTLGATTSGGDNVACELWCANRGVIRHVFAVQTVPPTRTLCEMLPTSPSCSPATTTASPLGVVKCRICDTIISTLNAREVACGVWNLCGRSETETASAVLNKRSESAVAQGRSHVTVVGNVVMLLSAKVRPDLSQTLKFRDKSFGTQS
jgi:hypothetical protein